MSEAKSPWIVRLDYDQMPSVCLDDFMFTEWKLYSFCRFHVNYRSLDLFDAEQDAELQQALQAGRAHWLHYYRHGLELWMRADGEIPAGVEFLWDGVRYAGILLYDEEPPAEWSYADFCRSADGYLEAYNAVINGQVYGFQIYDGSGNWVDSSTGYVGNIRGMLEEVAHVVAGEEFIVEGELKDYAEDLRELCSKLFRGQRDA